jgi:hypothetical protein
VKLTVAITFLLLACATAAVASARPDANFGFFPDVPLAGEPIQFVSYACDPAGKLRDQRWDLDGDGRFDDASGLVVTRAFPVGTYEVGLRATSRNGARATSRQTVVVYDGSPEDRGPLLLKPPPLLSPRPVVRLAGVLTRTGARISLLTVRAPVCSMVTVRCRGARCPVRRVSALTGRGLLRFHEFDGSKLPAGTQLEILVRRLDRIGKYTRFRIRRGAAPARMDSCLGYDARRPSPCDGSGGFAGPSQ